MDWALLAVGGFLIGSFLYSGWYTTRFEPKAKIAYAVIGVGLLASVASNIAIDLKHDVSDWYRAATLLSYAIVAAGLVLLVRTRRRK